MVTLSILPLLESAYGFSTPCLTSLSGLNSSPSCIEGSVLPQSAPSISPLEKMLKVYSVSEAPTVSLDVTLIAWFGSWARLMVPVKVSVAVSS